MPVVVSVLIFIIYYIINNTGYKMARDGNWEVWQGMWISSFILAPIGVFFTYKSNKDSVVFNADTYLSWIKRIIGIRVTRHLFKKEVIIHDPDYNRIDKDMDTLNTDCREYIQKHRLTSVPNYINIWKKNEQDEDITIINEKMEAMVDELSNTKQTDILKYLNNYPVLSVYAHKSPFKKEIFNIIAGILFPIGLIFYFRIWMFRIRLNKDLQEIIKTNKEIQNIIKNNNI